MVELAFQRLGHLDFLPLGTIFRSLAAVHLKLRPCPSLMLLRWYEKIRWRVHCEEPSNELHQVSFEGTIAACTETSEVRILQPKQPVL